MFLADGVVTVTWADLAFFARCPLQFAFDRTGVEASDDAAARRGSEAAALPKGIDPAVFGSFVHAGLEALALHPTTSIDDALASVSVRFDIGKNPKEVVRAARARIEPLVATLPFTASTRAEVPFMVRVGSIMVRGVIDRLDESGEGAVVTDYKVGERADEHAFQARVYAWAVGRARGDSTVTGQVLYLRDGSAVLVDISSAEMSAEMERLAQSIDAAIQAGSFVATPGAACAGCRHRSGCEFAV
jgi:hypothetical protein